ncbi:hypothetical protein FRB99_002954 [Tulasnella sp. 403]|nr:hypothetical protein FRB99_002954 [Tulasnella sp. 403]
MRLRKNPPLVSSSPPPSSPPSTLRKPKPGPSEAPSSSDMGQSTTQPPLPSDPLVPVPRPSAHSTSRPSIPPSSQPLELSLNEDSSAGLSSSPTSASKPAVLTFRGWPIARKPPSSSRSSPPPPLPEHDGASSSSSSPWWSSFTPPNTQCDRLRSANVVSPTLTSSSSPPPSAPLSRCTSSASSAASSRSSCSVSSVTVTAPNVSAFSHPFIPKRPYSAPVCPEELLLPSVEQVKRRPATTGHHFQLHDAIPEGVAVGSPSSSSAPLAMQHMMNISNDTAADNTTPDHSGRSIIHAVTVVNEPDKFLLHIKLPGFSHSNLLISARRDRSLLISADKFDDEVYRPPSSQHPVDPQPSRSTRPPTPPEPERAAGHFERCVQFGPDAEPSKATAHFDGETLVVIVPKRRTWVEFISRNGGSEQTLTLPEEMGDKSPRSIALALSSRRTEGHEPRDDSPGSEASTSTTPESEMGSGTASSSEETVPSPTSETNDPDLGEVVKRLDDMDTSEKVDGRQDFVMTVDDAPATSTAMTPTFATMRLSSPLPSPPPTATCPTVLSAKRPRSKSPPSVGGGPLRTRSRSPRPNRSAHPRGSSVHCSSAVSFTDVDMEVHSEAVRSQLGYDDDLVTPTPSRVRWNRAHPLHEADRDSTGGTTGGTGTSPKRDYFGFPLAPILPTTAIQSYPSSGKVPRHRQSNSEPEKYHSRSMDMEGVEEMRVTIPQHVAAASPGSSHSLIGRSREQGMGRGAFFWKRWTGGTSNGHVE